MPTHHDIENEAPANMLHQSRGVKHSRPASSVLNDSGRPEKRQRNFKSQSTARRPALGDVTNRMLTEPTSTATSKPFSVASDKYSGFVPKRTTAPGANRTNIKKSSMMSTTATTSSMLARKQKLLKRTYPNRDLVRTTPVVNTLGSLALAEKNSHVDVVSVALAAIKEEDRASNHDIDSEDKHDANSCWQYAEDITRHHLETEKKRAVNPLYMGHQTDINSKMRAILVDWLVDVHFKYNLHPQTLHIAVHLLDRHLEQEAAIPRQRLQLVGITSLFVASKYEEIYPPEARDFIRITDCAYTRKELFAMEVDLLASIEYRVTFPTSHQFLKRFLKASRTCDDRVEHFAHYIIDRSLQEYKLIKYAPSLIAAAAVHIAKVQMEDLPAWNSTLEHHSSYSEASMWKCIEDLKDMLWNAQNGVGKQSKLTAVRRKFEKERFMGVASHPLVFEDTKRICNGI